jgi:predicted nucleic acid binding AN1-type Zn finger protein
MNPLKFWLENRKIKKEKKKEQQREEHFKKVNKRRKYYHCQFRGCGNELKGLTYTCPYCHKRFCEKHRLPENHKCKDPRKPQEFKKGTGKKIRHENEKRGVEAETN